MKATSLAGWEPLDVLETNSNAEAVSFVEYYLTHSHNLVVTSYHLISSLFPGSIINSSWIVNKLKLNANIFSFHPIHNVGKQAVQGKRFEEN